MLHALLAIFLVSFCPHGLCSCMGTATPQQERDESSATVLGRVLSIDSVPTAQFPTWQHVRLLTEAVWKGPSRDTFELYTGMNAADCGYPFRVGARYLVYLRLAGDRLLAGTCSGTSSADSAGRALAALGGPKWRPRSTQPPN